MPIFVQTTAQSELLVGTPLVLQRSAPSGQYAAVLEDDGETGYFYALNLADPGRPIQDALHIYNVQQVEDRNEPSDVRIGWSSDALGSAPGNQWQCTCRLQLRHAAGLLQNRISAS